MPCDPPKKSPQPLPVNPDGIPDELQQLNQWVLWKYEFRDGKPTKVPYQINGNKASTTNPATWNTFAAVWEAYQRGGYAGIGFVFGKGGGFVGIDLDDCFHTHGKLKPWAQTIVDRFPHAYWERSPSRTGLHGILRGSISTNKTGERIKVSDGVIEVYQHGRYFCVTGHRFREGDFDLINDNPDLASWFTETFRKPKPKSKTKKTVANPPASVTVSLSDERIIQLASSAKNGDKFKKLWSGDISDYPSHSEADLALCGMLAFYTGPEESRIDGLFRQSGLMTEKWEQREDYRQSTIAKTLEGRNEFYTPQRRQAASSTELIEGCQYLSTKHGLFYLKPTKDGHISVQLTNFTAEIVGDIALDDGAEIRRVFEMNAVLNNSSHAFSVPATQFSSLNWVTEHLGASAIVFPGFSTKDHTRAGIQFLSNNISSRTIYGHFGWRKHGGVWIYLHSGGAIGPNGSVTDIEVQVPSLERYVLPETFSKSELIAAIRASLKLLDVAPQCIMYPILAAVWRSAITKADFAVFLVGPTGTAKSEISARAQQHFGAGMDARHLPANWSSTGNSLESTAFVCKDSLLVIDDFAPQGSASDIARYHRDADRVFRSQGNSAGRARMRSDTTLRPARNPRGLILSTGEDVPKGHSVRARCLVLEISPNDTNWDALTVCQRDAADGQYAIVMAGYVRWLSQRYEQIIARHKTKVIELRDHAHRTAAHRRTPSIVAELAFGGELFLEFCVDTGALTQAAANEHFTHLWDALGQAANAQQAHQAAADPVNRFLELLSSAIISGEGHLAALDGSEPQQPQTWGWRLREFGSGEHLRHEWNPCGDRIGWVDDHGIYLDGTAAYRVAKRMSAGDGLPLAANTLFKRLHERHLLLSADPDRHTIKKQVEGKRLRVLHLHVEALCADSGASGASGAQAPNSSPKSPSFRPGFKEIVEYPGQQAGQKPRENRPTAPEAPDAPLLTQPPQTSEALSVETPNDDRWVEFAVKIATQAEQEGEEGEWTL